MSHYHVSPMTYPGILTTIRDEIPACPLMMYTDRRDRSRANVPARASRVSAGS